MITYDYPIHWIQRGLSVALGVEEFAAIATIATIAIWIATIAIRIATIVLIGATLAISVKLI
jgi:hypothetical protein